ncbi:hypothetical protein ABPG77_007715 [Micractinium sp. CCAP 211/92]
MDGTEDRERLWPLLRHAHAVSTALGPSTSSNDVEAAPASLAAAWVGAQAIVEEPAPRFVRSSLRDTTVNLTNAILGAGMLAMPRAFAGLGVLGGAACVAAVGLMTHFSIVLMLRPTERTGKLTYAAVVGHECGPGWGVAVRASIIIGSAGFLVLYLIILGDLLVGSKHFSGIIPDLWPGLPDPLPWYLQRTAVLTWATLAVAPSLAPATLGGVAPISALKVFCTFLCVLSLLVLCAAMAVQGRLPTVHWLPDPAFFGDGALERAKNALGIVPVVMTAFVCHMSVHPLVQDLERYTPRRMRVAVAASMLATGLIYFLTGAAGFLVWGQQVCGDVLSNMTIDGVTDILWGHVPLAMAFVTTVKVSMALSLVLSFPITLWPMRQDIIETLADMFVARQLSPAAYYVLTYLSLLLIYLVAISISSAYQMVGLIGSVTGTSMAFLFPGMLALRDARGGRPLKAFGWGLLLAGILLTIVGIATADDE